MPTVIVGNEENFAALRPRLFTGRVSTKTASEVAEQVQEANPHVDLDKLTPGTVLVIPGAANVDVQGDLSLDEPTRDDLKGLAEHGKTVLGEVVAAADQREAEMRDERARAVEALDMIDTGTRAPHEPQLAKRLTAARKALADEDERAKQREETLKRAQSEWTEGLDVLLQRLG
jgi:hypothetical protein